MSPKFEIDSLAFPTASAYLQQLPDGLNSFPTCKQEQNYPRMLSTMKAELLQDERLPEVLRQQLEFRELRFYPEVLTTLQLHLVRDLHPSEPTFLFQHQRIVRQLFDLAWYSRIMKMLTPNMMLAASTKNYAQYHHGTMLERVGKGTDNTAQLFLSAPEHLFTPLAFKVFAISFEEALKCSRAAKADVRAEPAGRGNATFYVKWS